jgi:beta-lactam-binding protein with PASTA domain
METVYNYRSMARRRKKGENKTTVYIALGATILLLLGAIIFGFMQLIRLFEGDIGTGGATVKVPNIVGMDVASADAALAAAGLKSKRLADNYHDTQPKDRIFQQEPGASDVIKPGRVVRYHVSLGPANFSVPSLIGKQLSEAPAILGKAGLQLGTVHKIYSQDVPPGRILNQDPKMGNEYTTSIQVDLVVADNQNLPEVSMPNLIGLPLSQAEEMLTLSQTNLHLARVRYIADDVSPAGTVVAQSISTGENVPLGSDIEVSVALPGLLMAQPQKTVQVRIPVPRGPEKQAVKIKVNDALGSKVELSGEHAPGDVIERSIDVEGAATIQIFIGSDKKPYREEII